MTTGQVITMIVSIIFVILLAGFLFFNYKRKKDAENEAYNFLNGLKDTIMNKMYQFIKDFKYDEYESLVGIELDLINQLTLEAEDYIQDELEKNYPVLSALTRKVFTPGFIDNYISKLINGIDLEASIEEQLGDRYKTLFDKFESEEKELDAQYSNDELYYEDDTEVKLEEVKEEELPENDDNGLKERGFVKPNKKEESELNPQVEDEEQFNSNDESMELIDDNTYVDSKGRLHDKSTGKYIKSKK